MGEQQLYWHCLSCGAHETVEPTGDEGAYSLGDCEPCISCDGGTAHVMTVKMAAAYEQGRALSMNCGDAWERAKVVTKDQPATGAPTRCRCGTVCGNPSCFEPATGAGRSTACPTCGVADDEISRMRNALREVYRLCSRDNFVLRGPALISRVRPIIEGAVRELFSEKGGDDDG